jgi:glycyl-tRNA synthetase
MFASEIGPTGQLKGYLRPETAQGIFLNFRRLLDFNNGKMPFAGAQIGLGFRNEIRPQQGLLRVREFQMAEIEHFVDPQDKSHHKFHLVADHCLPLLTAKNQEGDGAIIYDMTMAQAVSSGTVGNQTLGYFIARTYQFLKDCGIKPEAIRFRQHRSNEMAHYAQDCWDAEVETSYGWIEVAGHSDRSCFDLQRHSEKTKTDLVAPRLLKEPKVVKYIHITIDKQKMGKALKKDQKPVVDLIESWDEDQK